MNISPWTKIPYVGQLILIDQYIIYEWLNLAKKNRKIRREGN